MQGSGCEATDPWRGSYTICMLPQSFFQQNAEDLAPQLLGKLLVHETSEGVTSGIIVETEAYSQGDAASHSCNGITPRTKVMFESGGYAYVYFTYGMHYCFNVVSGPKDHGQAVLIRAIEPVDGIELMMRRRNKEDDKILTNGPAKMVQAMGITKTDYGVPLFEGKLRIEEYGGSTPDVMIGPRVGISKAVDVPWRFWIKGNRFVSKI